MAKWDRESLERPLQPASGGAWEIFKMASTCPHLKKDMKIVSTDVDVCEDCVKTGDTWVNLRLCTECGHVGCCDSSKNKHATKHFHRTKHPVIRSIEPGETWTWCYIDEVMGELSRAS